MPRITNSFDNAAFLAEGVVAAMEVKSDLTQENLATSCQAAFDHKCLRRSPMLHCFGAPPPEGILSYVVSFACGSRISTVASWLPEISKKLHIEPNKLVDIVVVLGKGIIFQAETFSSLPGFKRLETDTQWVFFEQNEKNLFMLFVHMLTWISFISCPPSALGYISKVSFERYETI